MNLNHSPLVAIDLAKNSFQICLFDKNGKIKSNKAMTRKALIVFLSNLSPSIVAMESCGGSHYWARLAMKCGHNVKVMNSKIVKAFRINQKTDKNDAVAIGIAAQMPHIRSCAILTEQTQGLQSISRVRDLKITFKTALTNQIRGLLLEFGIVINKGDNHLIKEMPFILEDAENNLPDNFRLLLASQKEALDGLIEQIVFLDKQIAQQVNNDVISKKLMALEGVGPIAALGLAIRLGSGTEFINGRDASAAIGLTPKQHSTGGKERIGHIAKNNSDKRLRSNLFQGALSVVSIISKREPRTIKERWLKAVIERRGMKIAAIALANKTVRTAVAIIKNNTEYQPIKLSA
jgi:transposase